MHFVLGGRHLSHMSRQGRLAQGYSRCGFDARHTATNDKRRALRLIISTGMRRALTSVKSRAVDDMVGKFRQPRYTGDVFLREIARCDYEEVEILRTELFSRGATSRNCQYCVLQLADNFEHTSLEATGLSISRHRLCALSPRLCIPVSKCPLGYIAPHSKTDSEPLV